MNLIVIVNIFSDLYIFIFWLHLLCLFIVQWRKFVRNSHQIKLIPTLHCVSFPFQVRRQNFNLFLPFQIYLSILNLIGQTIYIYLVESSNHNHSRFHIFNLWYSDLLKRIIKYIEKLWAFQNKWNLTESAVIILIAFNFCKR